ncbi:MAG: hypothetical protein F4Y44_07600 [Chloroflexi bacterium]|nr:hypothetical protein [Chloroflexota bacterium]
MSDKVTYSMSGVSMLDKGMAYEGWLANSGNDEKVSTGIMTVLPDGSISHSWNHPDGVDLLALYDTVMITVESVPDDDPAPSEVVAFSNTLPSDLLDPVRELVVGEQAVVPMLQAQISAATGKIGEAQAADTTDALHAATQEAVDIIDTEDGIIALAAKTEELGASVYQAATLALVKDACECVMKSGENVQAWANAAKEDAAAVMAEDDLDTAKVLLNIVNGKLIAAANGNDAASMGGASDAYTHAQKIATFTLPAPTAAVAAPSVGDSYVPAAMQVMLLVALALLIGGCAILHRARRISTEV